MASIYDWSTTAASNTNSDSAINWVEGQLPGTVNNSTRAMMGRLAELVKDLGGALTAGGTANALTVTANSAFTTNVDGRFLAFRAASSNTTAATLNVNGIAAKSIRKMSASGDVALTGTEIQANGIYLVNYSAAVNGATGGWVLINPTQDISGFATKTGVETLTNKTLTSPAINTPTITGGTSASMTITGAALNGTLGATTPSTVVATTGTFSGALSATSAAFSGSIDLQNGIIGRTAATISLRPAGIGSTTGQMTVVPGGAVTINGTMTSTGIADAASYTKSGTALPFQSAYESAQQTITSGGGFTLAHGLGTTPKFVLVVLQCVTAELGYSIGDEVFYNSGVTDAGGNKGTSIVPDVTNLIVRIGSDVAPIGVIRKDTGGYASVTKANWKIVVRAWA